MDMSWDELCARAKARPAIATEADVAEVERLKTLTAALEHELDFVHQQLAIERQRAADCQTIVLELTEIADELRAALEPLAEAHIVDALSDAPDSIQRSFIMTLGDVRRAKRALGRGK